MVARLQPTRMPELVHPLDEAPDCVAILDRPAARATSSPCSCHVVTIIMQVMSACQHK